MLALLPRTSTSSAAGCCQDTYQNMSQNENSDDDAGSSDSYISSEASFEADLTKPIDPIVIAKGKKLIEWMDAAPKDSETFQSKWTDIRELGAHNWETTSDHFDDIGITWTAADMIGIDSVGNDHGGNRHVRLYHSPTQAKYKNVFNIKKGTIIGDSIQSPAGCDIPEDKLPALAHWSDTTFLQWQEMTKDTGSIGNLKYVVYNCIGNTTTKEIMKRVANNKLDLPGRIFTLGTDEFAALVGTPLGAAPAYLLAQHKKQLGWKRIQSIKIFIVGDKREQPLYQMILEFEAHPSATAGG